MPWRCSMCNINEHCYGDNPRCFCEYCTVDEDDLEEGEDDP